MRKQPPLPNAVSEKIKKYIKHLFVRVQFLCSLIIYYVNKRS